MATKLKPRWQCDECGDIHEDEEDAYDCCRPRVRMVYVCPECGDDYSEEVEALDCCGHDEDAPPHPSTAELEAAGQLRLLP